MSPAAVDPAIAATATTTTHPGEDVVTSKGGSAPAVQSSDADAELHTALDHFRTSFLAHFHDLIKPLYVHRLNAKSGSQLDDEFKDHWSHSKHSDGFTERRIHPFVDMCERKSDYLVDIDMPGLEDKESITVQWTSPRTLLIEVLIFRPPIEDWDAETDAAKTKLGDASNDEEVNWISSERRIGKLVRILFFPSDVDMKALKARLRAGVLRIQVPKRFAGFEGWKVQVE